MRAAVIVEGLHRQGATHVVGLPDSGMRAPFERLGADPALEVIPVTREGEDFAVASGLYLEGGCPVVIMQNTGFLETGDAFRGTACNMGVLLVVLLGYRGCQTLRAEAGVDTAASFLGPTLKARNVPCSIMLGDERAAEPACNGPAPAARTPSSTPDWSSTSPRRGRWCTHGGSTPVMSRCHGRSRGSGKARGAGGGR